MEYEKKRRLGISVTLVIKSAETPPPVLVRMVTTVTGISTGSINPCPKPWWSTVYFSIPWVLNP